MSQRYREKLVYSQQHRSPMPPFSPVFPCHCAVGVAGRDPSSRLRTAIEHRSTVPPPPGTYSPRHTVPGYGIGHSGTMFGESRTSCNTVLLARPAAHTPGGYPPSVSWSPARPRVRTVAPTNPPTRAGQLVPRPPSCEGTVTPCPVSWSPHRSSVRTVHRSSLCLPVFLIQLIVQLRTDRRDIP